MDLKIETATIKSLERLYEIERLSFLREAFSKQQICYLLADYNAISIVAKVEGEIIGFAIGRLEVARGTLWGHIHTLETLPSHRRRGIGERLLRELETLFREKGAVESRLEVRENNAAAIELYKKIGYKRIGRLEKYYGDDHGIYFKKSLMHREG